MRQPQYFKWAHVCSELPWLRTQVACSPVYATRKVLLNEAGWGWDWQLYVLTRRLQQFSRDRVPTTYLPGHAWGLWCTMLKPHAAMASHAFIRFSTLAGAVGHTCLGLLCHGNHLQWRTAKNDMVA